MAYSRYSKRRIVVNDDIGYRDTFFTDRGINQIEQYTTNRTIFPTVDDLDNISTSPFRWQSDARLYKIANDYYGRPELWWIIAWFNRKPTEADFEVGETIYVPTPLSEVLYLYERVQEG